MRDKMNSLVKSYPQFFSTGRFSSFNVGDGWAILIERAIQDMIELGETPYPVAVQIKEKFGELRWYHAGATDNQQDIINRACLASMSTCEDCGEHGHLVKLHTGWVRTLCEDHGGEGAEVIR